MTWTMLALTALAMAATGFPSVTSAHIQQQQKRAQEAGCAMYLAQRHPMTPKEQRLVSAELHFKSNNASYSPALLWTYTGTGNTMTRMLIEVASGFYTGSVYTDLSLVDILPGEYLCDSSVIAVKAHPQWHSFDSLSPEGFRPDTPHVPPDAKDICPCAFTRAVAVIRDPYATFLAEYKRLRTHDYNACSHGLADGQACTGGHVSVIPKADFNASDFRVEVLRMATEWAAMFESYDAFAAARPQGFYLTTFENLTTPSTRTQALSDLLHALGVPPHHHDHEAISRTHCNTASKHTSTCAFMADAEQQAAATNAAVCTTDVKQHTQQAFQQPGCGVRHGYDQRRLECAFELAGHSQIYRPKDPSGIDAAYVYSSNLGVVCDVWGIVGSRAAGYGYSPYGGVTC